MFCDYEINATLGSRWHIEQCLPDAERENNFGEFQGRAIALPGDVEFISTRVCYECANLNFYCLGLNSY